MINKKLHNLITKKLNIRSFKAPKRNLQQFSSIQGVFKLLIPVIVFVLILGLLDQERAQSKRNLEIDFGTVKTINIFPTKVDSEDWSGVEQVLSQDLQDSALYQVFDAKNSAYIALQDFPAPELTASTSMDLATSSSHELEPLNDPKPAELEIEIEQIEQPDSSTINDGSIEPISVSVFDNVFTLSYELFPLAQLSVTTTTDDALEQKPFDEMDDGSDMELLNAEIENQEVAPTTTTEVDEVSSSSQQEIVEEMPSETKDVTVEEEAPTSTPEATELDEVAEIASSTLTETEIATSSESDFSPETYELKLSDFETAPLEPGQLINGVQLRLSLGSQLAQLNTGVTHKVEVLYGYGEDLKSAGAILLEDEISNALNGGYYLFALPSISKINELKDFNVVVRYLGDKDDLDGMFIDAVWLELDTRIVTDNDLKNRGLANQLSTLKKPQINELVSEQLNFKRDESPIFNLRYASQRNILVRGVRSMAGRDLVLVEDVKIKHHSFGLLGIQPEVDVTRDGLLTIQIPDDQKSKMRPGTYEVEIELNEGGHTSIDTFNFEWGVLSINPNKSEYEVGETAEIYMGALTPSGHTVCKANLDLYVTDPDGLMSKILIEPSGYCDGNNVTDKPDFETSFIADTSGEYKLYLERVDENGNVMSFTNDTFLVTPKQRLSIERTGPTRIYPPAIYPMVLTIDTSESFTGKLVERLPANFEVFNTDAKIVSDGIWQTLTWDVSILGPSQKQYSYDFDAPDLSPYLYNLGPAYLQGDSKEVVVEVASTTASTTEQKTVLEGGALFTEHRQWQIASDAVGNMILFWDDGASIPTDWTCLSCGSGTFYQRFVMGSSSYNTTGGAATHTHTAAGSVLSTSETGGETGSGDNAPISHAHTYTPTISAESNLPAYTQLRVIQYTAAAGEPTTIPAGAIAIFDVASSSLPTDWNRYTALDGRYIYGEDTPGTTGGSNTHTHTISGTTGVSSGGGTRSRGGTNNGALDTHTHTVSASTASANNEPPYVEVLFAQASTDVSPSNGIIAMWTEEVAGGWIDLSSNQGDPFNQKFLKAATTYGATGGDTEHTNPDVTGITTSGPSDVNNTVDGGSGASDTHTHQVDVTSFSTDAHLPPYLTAVFGKRQGTSPVYEQTSSQWYFNENLETPTDPWPEGGGTDLLEKEPITATSTPLKNGDEVRLRINVGVTNATATADSIYKLQYTPADVCNLATSWFDVGDSSSSTALWRGYNNASVSDHNQLNTLLLASSTVAGTYEENGYASNTPSDISVDDFGEWDFVLQQNGADEGTNYCFRMVEFDGTVFQTYSHYPQLYTNEAPSVQSLQAPFDNEKVGSSSPWFYFTANDTEGDKIHYSIEVDDNYDFSSPEIQRDTINNSSLFENQVLISDKAPFRPGELVEFIPSTSLATGTYYWRIQGQDPDGSNQWGAWSQIYSFTIDTTLEASAWHQTTDEQFDTNTLSGVETGSNEVALISGSTTGTMTSGPIDFTDGSTGTAWERLEFNDTETVGDITYQIEFLDTDDNWTLIPDADLSGNSTGFDGPTTVSLLSLDTDIYSNIRILATFTNSGGSPSLQDWTIYWGYRVETPTIAKPFPNEQIGTTTPTFQFTTSDPQNDSLTYQVQWSLTPDFVASTTRTSDTAPTSSFINIDSGSDYDPFNSGQDIQFTIQPADVLTGTTTYWWRVRAKDTTGDNAYSFWTEPQSFTVIPGTEVSTWYQTTDEQFESNTLSGTFALNGNVTVATTATEAMLVYGQGTESQPRYRQWNGSSWGSEGTLDDVASPIKWAVVKAGTTREEYVAATVGTDNDVNVQVFSTGEWSNLTELTSSMGNTNARGFDIAYESLSGDAMVVFCDGDANPNFAIWNGSSWTIDPTGIVLASANNCEWIELEADPTSDEIILLSRDSTGGQYEAQVWSGSAWGNSTTQGSITDADHAGMALMYEESGNQAVIVTSDGNPARFRWDSWNGTAWAGAGTQAIGDDFEWGQLARDVGSDEMILCYQDEDSDAGVVRWTGTGWAGQVELTIDANAKNDPAFSCVFEDTAGRDNYIITTMSSTTGVGYYDWNNATWSTENYISGLGDSATMQLERTGDANILGIFFDDPNDTLSASAWDGSSWSTVTNLETDMSVDTAPFGQPYYLTPRNSGSEGTTIVSPGVDFDDGLGPYWNEFSWNDTQATPNEILYHIQYYTASGTWAFIPDADLPFNEAGTTTGPIDLSNLNTNTYNVLRPYAELSCNGPSDCPSISDWKIEWAGGITISGTAYQYDETSSSTSGTVAVAVNGILQTGKTGTIVNGDWSISNVTAFEGDIITVFVTSVADANEAVAVTRYDGQGDMSGLTLFERHLTLGSNDATTTPLTNADIGQYDFTNTEDVFFDLNGTTLTLCADTGCGDVELYVKSGTYYQPSGRFVTHDFENNGIFTAGSYIHEVNGSWEDYATSTMSGSTIVFSATSTVEHIGTTTVPVTSFNNILLGTTTGNATWTLPAVLDVNGNLTVSQGVLDRGDIEITIAGNLSTGANGYWTGISTTTFDGSGTANWSDGNATLQNIGYVVVDGVTKNITLAGNVAAESITIGANDTLDASASNYDITVYSDWLNQNNFIARSGDVIFASNASGNTITSAGDAFYNLTFSGIGGGWSFTESTLLVNNDFTVSTGTVTLPANGTTTIAGSFDATGGTFAHNNGTLYFTSNNPETLTFDGGLFTNPANNLTFNGGGSWTFSDTNATSSGDIRISQGAVNLPNGVLAVGGTLANIAGSFSGGSGIVLFYSTGAEVITAGGSAFNSLDFDGAGSWSFADTNVDANGDLVINQGTLTLPSGIMYVGGSYDNNATVTAGTGEMVFDSADTGETVSFGNSTLYDVTFSGVTGGWTINESATTTNDFSIATSSDWTLSSGQTLSVGGVFTNSVGGASTTWTGSTLALRAGNYSINTKTNAGDFYEILSISAGADIAMWNSSSSAYNVNSSGSLYSQDHNSVDGDLYIFGAYNKTAGSEYWSYDTDFDGTDLSGGSERQVDVRFASGASASLFATNFEILGDSVASTTIANQGSGTYVVNVSEGTTSAQYYEFANLGSTGLTFTGSTTIGTLNDGSFEIDVPGGSAITLATTTIDENPGLQIFRTTFSTSSTISAFNVAQTDGAPSSFWWFREGLGNLYGEDYDNDTGDPGSVRFDDSSLVITLSGTVYDSAGAPIVGGTCDGSTPVVRVMVNGVENSVVSCSNTDGSYVAPGIVVIGDPTITVYLDNASGGEKGSVITRTPTSDVSDLDIRQNRVIVRNEDTEALNIANLAVYDGSNDSDLQFIAATSTGDDTLIVSANNELYINATSTFTPNGIVTLTADSNLNSYDGTLYIANGATFNAYSTSTLTIGGRLVLNSSSTFNAASTLVLMNATTTGKSITAPSTITFNDLSFNGVSGGWNLGADIQVDGDMTITNGTLTGTGDITLPNGSLTGNGVLSMGGGTTTLATTTTLGGTSSWTFYNLQLGDGLFTGTTTPVFTSTTTISGKLTIATAHFLDAGATEWDLAGTGDVFVEDGTLLEDTSTIRYSGVGANVLSTQYYNLDINSGAGSQTYLATGLGIIVDGHLTVGGDAASVLDFNTNDPALDVNGNVIVRTNGTLDASDSAQFTIAGSYDNNGVFNGNTGLLEFDGAGTISIAAGASSFSNLLLEATGDVTVTENATSTSNWTLTNANSFTLSSGARLAVGGQFFNAETDANTTWTGSILHLYGGDNYSINASTTNDTYAFLEVDGTTQIRMWNSSAGTYNINSTASLYSQDHANSDGDLYIWGTYSNSSNADYWNYATDFDGTSLNGVERKVDVYFASGASALITGGTLDVRGSTNASTTVQNQGAGTYSLLVGGNASTTFNYYEIRDIDSNGLVLTSSPIVNGLSYGDFEVSQNGGSAITVGGTVITANPAKNFTQNRFALNGVGSGFNVTATGTSVSSWRFANHYGDIDGEAFDVDPDGDPGYVAWDDSAALITISGNVYSDEGVTTSGVCDGATNNVLLRIAGITTYTTSCNATTGAYSISNVSYGSTDSLVVYIDGETENGATVSKEPVSNISNLNIYENRVIVRHESVNPITIADMAVWDSSDDVADIPFTAVNAGTDTLTLPSNTKLIVWTGKEFEPGGDVTLSGGGAGAVYDGTLQLQSNSTWTGQGSEALSVGGSMILDANAEFVASNGTTTFTTDDTGRTIDVNEDSFNNVAFAGSGDWTITDVVSTFDGNVLISAGTLSLSTGTTTFNGSFINSGGAFNANNGYALFTGLNNTVTLGGSDLSTIEFAGGNYTFGDVNATTTGSTTISSGDLTLPSGTLAVGGDFINYGADITHNDSNLIMTSPAAAILQASTSDLYSVTFAGGGNYTTAEEPLSLLGNLFITDGFVTLPLATTTSIGGSFDATGGTFDSATGTLLFNSSDGGEFIDPGVSNFYNVQISAPAGGYTITGDATTTNNFTLSSANSFTLQSGTVLNVEGVFLNSVGDSNTTWSGSTLKLDGTNEYTINTKALGADQYESLIIGANSDIRMWNSVATTTTVDSSSSLYSQDHAAVDGDLYIYGDLHISTTTEAWSYATDFDLVDLTGGSERAVNVYMAENSTTTVDGGTLSIMGATGNETTITNQGSGTYALEVNDGTFGASYYALRNLNADGLKLNGTPSVTSLSYGDFELAVDGGSLISLSSTTLNANASLVITGNRFATTTAITGYNVNLTGVTSNAWTFVSHTGNLDGENFDIDGVDACGSVRWSDSSCLLTQQTNYRWRNDDGGIGVPNSEWYNASWDARKRISVTNVDAVEYTDAAVQLFVDYDSDMQTDFDDLRFASSDGTTLLSHWIGSTTPSATAEVWVKIPTLTSEDITTIYMYYNNPAATSSASSSQVFIASDDFEDDDIAEYSGTDSGLFNVDTTRAFDGNYGMDNAGNTTGRAVNGGIYRTDETISQGQTIRYMQYINSASSLDEVCTKFGIQGTDVPNDNYAICIKLSGSDKLSIVKDAKENESEGSASILASVVPSSQFTTGWHEIEVDWGTDDSIYVEIRDSFGNVEATTTATDSSYTTGDYGFSYWYNSGAWDSFSSRPTLTTEPSIQFGAEQTDGGASWNANQDTPGVYDVNEIARLRLAIENSGLAITNQQFLLEYAELGSSPSCEAVDTNDYVSVPVQSSCGTSPICMISSSNITNGASTFDLLTETNGSFTAGEAREDPTNITGSINIDQSEFTELEYALTPTTNVVDQNLCLRVTDNGTEYDTYLRVARLTLRFDPSLTNVTLNDGLPISLLPGTTTTVYATGTVTDLNGFADIEHATATFYRSGVGAACTEDNNNCYVASGNSCQFTDCLGYSCTVSCTADFYFHADPTDTDSPYEGEEWFGFIEVEDASAGYDSETSIGQELNTLRAIDVAGLIDYGTLTVNSDTGSTNASTSVYNQGNVEINLEIQGTDLSDGISSVIPSNQQKFATTTFNYSTCGAVCDVLSSTTPVALDVDLTKPTTDSPPIEDDVFWGIFVPFGINSTAHEGINVFTPISP